MRADLEELVAFHLAGQRQSRDRAGAPGLLEEVAGRNLRPALFARYRDLSALRHDYPLVLAEGEAGGVPVVSLSGLIDDLVAGLAAELPAAEHERLRHHALRLEREIRREIAAGAAGTLSGLWGRVESRLLEESNGDGLLVDSLGRLHAALDRTRIDGALAGCDGGLAERLVTHLWRAGQRERARVARRRLERLSRRLGDILRADEATSTEGLAPERSRATFGGSAGGSFGGEMDFGAVSRLLTTARPIVRLPEERRRRIELLLAELAGLADDPAPAEAPFESCVAALSAWRRATAQRVERVRATLAAELEIEGTYRDAIHDALFAALGDEELGPAARELFPDPLVVVAADAMTPEEGAALDEILAAGLPMKIVLRTDDLAAPSAPANGPAGAPARARALAAIGVGGVFVVQSAASHLYRQREALRRAGAFGGPALVSVYSGAGGALGGLPPYLAAAAAVEARAFPSFVFDPGAGEDLAARFSLDQNPQPGADWPIRTLEYEDAALQRVEAELPFTFADFLACDARWSSELAGIPRERWNGSLTGVSEAVTSDPTGLPEKVPALFLVDDADVLHRVVVGSRIVRLARRAREQWRSLQELGGIRSSHAERRLAVERAAWEEAHRASAAATEPVAASLATAAPVAAPPAEPTAGAAAPAPPAHTRDEAWIETSRCSTCNECLGVNDRMFKYDANKQAYLADPAAGTYAQLVLAAESCQVAIIHPGKPRDAAEPGLDELLARAEPFR
jgi:hypothetical protein